MQRLTRLLVPVVLFVCASVLCPAQPQSLLTRHVGDVVLNVQAPFVGQLPGSQSLRLDIVLALRDQAGLDHFLQEVYDPSNPSYRQFLTVEQFTERFGPSRQDYEAVVRFAKESGLRVVGGSRDALDVQVKGSVASIESAFHVTLGLYHDPVQNRDFYAVDQEPTVDLPFQLWHISGLDNYSIPRSALVRRPPSKKPYSAIGSCPDYWFCGSDMRAAYYEGTSLTGKGQNIGFFEPYGYYIGDVNTYYQNAKQKRVGTIKGISTDGTNLTCVFVAQGCDDSEQTLDIIQALGMAPKATVYLYVGSSDTAILGSMVSHKPLPLQLGSSWRSLWEDPAVDDPYFKRMAAQGQSFFKAAGSRGAWGGNSCTGGVWPGDDAYVTSVGGTFLLTKGPGKGWAGETGWGGGGGGYCPVDSIHIPNWQKLKGVITKANQGSNTWRNGPDVSANANLDFYICADQRPCYGGLGGTSYSTAIWVGYMALANEQAVANKKPPIGFINPLIYPLGLGKSYHDLFHDITSGTNGNPPTKGYNLVGGWGSPKTDGLINTLAGSE